MKTEIKMTFDPTIAKEIGVEEAIMLSNISFWVAKNQANKNNFHEGYYWTYNTTEAFVELFPFWTVEQVKRILRNLTKAGYVKKGRFNKKGYDRTCWFTVVNQPMDKLVPTNGLVGTNQPIPDNKPYSKQQINTDVSEQDVQTPKPKVLVSGQLPDIRGKTYITRVLSVYQDLFRNKYQASATVPIPRFAKALKQLLCTHTELQIASLLICFFNWHGMSGSDTSEHEKLLKATFNPFWFFSSITQYEIYLRNVFGLEFDNEEKVRVFVAKTLLELKG